MIREPFVPSTGVNLHIAKPQAEQSVRYQAAVVACAAGAVDDEYGLVWAALRMGAKCR